MSELDLTVGLETAGSKFPIRMTFTYRNGGTPYLASESGLWLSTPLDLLKLMPSSLPYVQSIQSHQAVQNSKASFLSGVFLTIKEKRPSQRTYCQLQ